MVLVSVFVRNEEIHSLFQKLSEGLSSLGSKTKMLSLDQCDELMIIYDTILIEVDLSKGFHVIFKKKQIHGCLTSSIILSFNGFGTDSFHTGSSSRISMNFSSGIFPSWKDHFKTHGKYPKKPTCFPSTSRSNLSNIGLQSSSRMVELDPSEAMVRLVESALPSRRRLRYEPRAL